MPSKIYPTTGTISRLEAESPLCLARTAISLHKDKVVVKATFHGKVNSKIKTGEGTLQYQISADLLVSFDERCLREDTLK